MNTDEQVRTALGHLAESAPTPPSWESVRSRLLPPTISHSTRRWPAVVLVMAAVCVAVVGLRLAATTGPSERVQVSADGSPVPSTTIPTAVTTDGRPSTGAPEGPPQAVLVASAGTVSLPAAGYCWTTGLQAGISQGKCASGPGDGQTLQARAGERVAVSFTSEAPTSLTANVIEGIPAPGVIADQQFLTVDGTTPATISIDLPAGSYKLNIDGRWSQGSASYVAMLDVVARATPQTTPLAGDSADTGSAALRTQDTAPAPVATTTVAPTTQVVQCPTWTGPESAATGPAACGVPLDHEVGPTRGGPSTPASVPTAPAGK